MGLEGKEFAEGSGLWSLLVVVLVVQELELPLELGLVGRLVELSVVLPVAHRELAVETQVLAVLPVVQVLVLPPALVPRLAEGLVGGLVEHSAELPVVHSLPVV